LNFDEYVVATVCANPYAAKFAVSNVEKFCDHCNNAPSAVGRKLRDMKSSWIKTPRPP